MSRAVLDASAVLAVVLDEPGGAAVHPHLRGGLISAVNYAEVLDRTGRRCGSLESARQRVGRCDLQVVPFDADQAATVAALRPATDPAGLSLADRACLALGLARGVPVLTADRAWRDLDVGVAIEVIR